MKEGSGVVALATTRTPQQQQHNNRKEEEEIQIHSSYTATTTQSTGLPKPPPQHLALTPEEDFLRDTYYYGKGMENIWRMSTRPRYILGAATVHHVRVRLHVRRENRGVNHAHSQQCQPLFLLYWFARGTSPLVGIVRQKLGRHPCCVLLPKFRENGWKRYSKVAERRKS